MPTSAYHDPLVGSTEWLLIYLKCSISFDWFYLPLWNWRLLFFYFRLICRQMHSERMSTQSEWKFGCMVNWMPWKTLQPSNQSALTDSQRQLWQFPSKFVTDQFHAGIQSKVNQQLMKTWFDRHFSKSWDFGRFASHSNVSDVSDCKNHERDFHYHLRFGITDQQLTASVTRIHIHDYPMNIHFIDWKMIERKVLSLIMLSHLK